MAKAVAHILWLCLCFYYSVVSCCICSASKLKEKNTGMFLGEAVILYACMGGISVPEKANSNNCRLCLPDV